MDAPDGFRAIETIQPGEVIFSRDESMPSGRVEAKVVEEVFERFGPVLHLHVGGQVIRTTAEHPFFAYVKGWIAAQDLLPDDYLLSETGEWKHVEEVFDTGEWEPVYNLRVADWHTYFVGDTDWGWACWSHNACKDYYITEDSDPMYRGKYTLFDKKNGSRVTGTDGKSRWKSSFAEMKDFLGTQAATSAGLPAMNRVYANEPDAGSGWAKVLESFDQGRDFLTVKKPDPLRFDMHLLNPQKYPTPGTFKDGHAHHLVMERGGQAARNDVRRAQHVLRSVGIDPFFSKENLYWAPNFSHHNPQYAKDVADQLQDALADGGRAKVVGALEELINDFKIGVWNV